MMRRSVGNSTGAYAVDVDEGAPLVKLSFSGFLDIATVNQLKMDLASTIGTLRCRSGEHTVLCDIADATVQAQDIIAAIGELIEAAPVKARRIAFILPASALSRMQARRLGLDDRIRFFDAADPARDWLRG